MKMKNILILRIITWFFAILWVLPLVGFFMTSIRPFEEITSGWWDLKDATFTLKNYIESFIFSAAPIWRGLINSIFVAVPSTVLPLIIAFLAGYALSRSKYWFGKLFLIVLLVFIVMPAEAILLPLYSTFIKIGLMGTRFAVIIIMSARAVPWITVFFLNYFNSIPYTYEEAAMIDGANYWQILTKIMRPLANPAIISLSVLQFVGAWNTFIYALIFLQPIPNKWTAIQMIPFFKGGESFDLSLLCAASVWVMIIPIVIFFTLYSYFVKGIVGSIEK